MFVIFTTQKAFLISFVTMLLICLCKKFNMQVLSTVPVKRKSKYTFLVEVLYFFLKSTKTECNKGLIYRRPPTYDPPLLRPFLK
jgi:hypothetical protein